MNKLLFPNLMKAPHYLVSVGPGVSEEMSFENVAEANDGQLTTAYSISSPGAFSSSELIKWQESTKYIQSP